MSNVQRSLGAMVLGVFTSLLATFIVFAVSTSGLNLYSLNILLVIPVGAFFTGLFAASGYFVVGVFFHKRPGGLFLVQMLVVAISTQILLYYAGYATLVFDNGAKAAQIMSFREYIDLYLSSAQYRIGRYLQHETPEVGSLGYWIAGLQFVAFLIAYFIIWGILKLQPVCSNCNLVLRRLAKREHSFADSIKALAFHHSLLYYGPESLSFESQIQSEETAKEEEGAVKITTILTECPQCQLQEVEVSVETYDGRDWKTIDDLHTGLPVPVGIDIRRAFKGPEPHEGLAQA